MRHLLNNLTEQEKNHIRGQHKESIKVVTENFSRLLNSKSGNIKPLVSEQEEPMSDVGSAVARYVVKPGDNLTKIAKMVNSTVEELMKNNPEIKDPNKIDIGQEIVIVSK
jgi:LysM repeat protein